MTLAGCDYFSETRVCNQTNKKVILKVTFDSEIVDSWSSGMLAKDITKTFEEWDANLEPIDIDTVNYVCLYSIKPDSCGSIDGGNTPRPSFHFYKELEIITEKDTMTLRTEEDMRKAFDADRDKRDYYYDLVILNNITVSSR